MRIEADLTVTSGLHSKIGTLERRLEHLQSRLDKGTGGDRAREFDAQEADALMLALAAIKHHRRALDKETTAAMIARDLIASMKAFFAGGMASSVTQQVVADAADALSELEEEKG